MRYAFLLASIVLLLGAVPPAAAQGILESSNLPIVLIDTDGALIPDEPKIPAHLGVIDNGPGNRNHVTDPFNGYDGRIAIEVRGNSSQKYPKKSYDFETRNADESNNNVALLGMPEENDWILHGPYADKSLLRNVIAYDLARRMGHYASRVRFCEVVINGGYRGVYVLMEQIKRDANRVDIATLRPDETEGDDLTGGYIIQVDRETEGGGWESDYLSNGFPAHYRYHYPEPSDIAPEQARYIEDFIGDFEDVMASEAFEDPELGYPGILDVDSFVDYFLLSELAKNVDAYRLSSYMYKDKNSNNGRLVMGPAWDFNIAFGSAYFRDGDHPYGFNINNSGGMIPVPIPFWWHRLVESHAFHDALTERWAVLRTGPFHVDSLHALVDEYVALLEEAQARNFERWPVLGEWVWPNAFVGQTYEDEIDYLKDWFFRRTRWLDMNLEGLLTDNEPAGGESPPAESAFAAFPTPATEDVVFRLRLHEAQASVRLAVHDVLGRQVARLYDGPLEAGVHRFTWPGKASSSGTYFVTVQGEGIRFRERVALVR